jgi:hypothetical protein
MASTKRHSRIGTMNRVAGSAGILPASSGQELRRQDAGAPRFMGSLDEPCAPQGLAGRADFILGWSQYRTAQPNPKHRENIAL